MGCINVLVQDDNNANSTFRTLKMQDSTVLFFITNTASFLFMCTAMALIEPISECTYQGEIRLFRLQFIVLKKNAACQRGERAISVSFINPVIKAL